MELWYTDGSAAWKVSVSNGMGFEKTSISYKTGSGMIFCAVDGYTSTSISQLWYIENGRPTSADSGDLGEVRQYGDSDFTFVSDVYDLGMDGTGHTWKAYYAYWNGAGFTEYGGIPVSIEQLCCVKGASKWIDEIFAEGYALMGIYYRASGVVNINYTDYDMNYNATLQIDDGTAQLVRADDCGSASTLSESSYGGFYEASVLGRATFPDRFPYEAETQPPTSSEGYARDLNGDGQEETVRVYEKIALTSMEFRCET